MHVDACMFSFLDACQYHVGATRMSNERLQAMREAMARESDVMMAQRHVGRAMRGCHRKRALRSDSSRVCDVLVAVVVCLGMLLFVDGVMATLVPRPDSWHEKCLHDGQKVGDNFIVKESTIRNVQKNTEE